MLQGVHWTWGMGSSWTYNKLMTVCVNALPLWCLLSKHLFGVLLVSKWNLQFLLKKILRWGLTGSCKVMTVRLSSRKIPAFLCRSEKNLAKDYLTQIYPFHLFKQGAVITLCFVSYGLKNLSHECTRNPQGPQQASELLLGELLGILQKAKVKLIITVSQFTCTPNIWSFSKSSGYRIF